MNLVLSCVDNFEARMAINTVRKTSFVIFIGNYFIPLAELFGV